MPKGYPAVVAGMVALSLIGACTEPKAAPSAPGVTVETLRARPWAQPDVGAGMPCPVSTAVSQPDPELGPLLGTGPARPAGLRDGLLGVTPAHLGTWRDREWAGQKVLWAVDRAAAGPILLRGAAARRAGTGRVRRSGGAGDGVR